MNGLHLLMLLPRRFRPCNVFMSLQAAMSCTQSGTEDHINTLGTRPMTQVLLVRTSLCWGTARYVSGNSFEYISNRDLKMSFEVGTVIFEGAGSMGSGQRTTAFTAHYLRLTLTSHDTLPAV